MIVPMKKRHEYWNHFLAEWALRRGGGPAYVTGARLAKIKDAIMADNVFWGDVVFRHGGLERTPEEMLQQDKFTYNHCSSNFWGMVVQDLIDKGLMEG